MRAAPLAAYIAALEEDTGWSWSEDGQRAAGTPTVTFASGVPLAVRVMLAFGADLTADPLTWVWTDITGYVRYAPGISASTGRVDESSQVNPGSGSLVLDNRDGRFSRKNPTGPYYGLLTRNTPIWVTLDPGTGAYDLLQQYVNEWPARGNKAATDFTVPIATGGILRRLRQGSVLKSTLLRYVSGTNPVAYWPMEEGTDATAFASALGGSAMSIAGGANPGSVSTLPGSGALPAPAAGCTIFGYPGTFPVDYDAESDNWSISWAMKIDAAPAAESTLLHWWVLSGPIGQWYINITAAGNIVVRGYNSTLTEVFADAGVSFAAYYGQWVVFTAAVTHDVTSPPDFAFTVRWQTSTASVSSTMATQSGVAGQPWAIEHLGFGASIGQLIVWPNNTASMADPAFGFALETAGARMLRICAEEGVRITVPDAASTSQMGPQPHATLLDILRDCEKTDRGVLYERGWELGYQSRAERYNAAVAMALDATAGQLAAAPEPTDDDQQLRNRWTITRSGGSARTAEDAACIADHGVYADADTVNVSTDDAALHLAEWLVHLGVMDDFRWPLVSLRFDNDGGRLLIPDWMRLGYGARMTIVNPPDQMTADPAAVFIEGRKEWTDSRLWTADLHTTPALPYEVFQVEGDGNRGRLDLTQTLAADVGTGDVSWSVATPGSDPLLTATADFPADFPFDVGIGGEQVTVSAVVGAASPQTVTVVRSVNGVVKAHAAGDAITLWNAGGLAL